MLTKEQLYTITNAPKFTDFSLQTLQDFYSTYLCSNTYIYHLASKDGNPGISIKLDFYKEHFCHLLGLHYIKANIPKAPEISGKSGYKDIEDGNITFSVLKGLNKPMFKDVAPRICYLPFLPRLLDKPNAIEFDYTKVKNCKIKCDILLYDDYTGAKILLGIEGKPHLYYPKTFLVDKKAGTKFIDKQQAITIESIEIIDKSAELAIIIA